MGFQEISTSVRDFTVVANPSVRATFTSTILFRFCDLADTNFSGFGIKILFCLFENVRLKNATALGERRRYAAARGIARAIIFILAGLIIIIIFSKDGGNSLFSLN